jgi:hypothetical protein
MRGLWPTHCSCRRVQKERGGLAKGHLSYKNLQLDLRFCFRYAASIRGLCRMPHRLELVSADPILFEENTQPTKSLIVLNLEHRCVSQKGEIGLLCQTMLRPQRIVNATNA